MHAQFQDNGCAMLSGGAEAPPECYRDDNYFDIGCGLLKGVRRQKPNNDDDEEG